MSDNSTKCGLCGETLVREFAFEKILSTVNTVIISVVHIYLWWNIHRETLKTK